MVIVRKAKNNILPLIVAAGLALGGCGSFAPNDDPANPAELGAWSMTSVVESMSINGMTMGRAALVADGGADDWLTELERGEQKSCTEPGMRTDAGLASVFPGADLGDCTVTEASGSVASGHTMLACTKTPTADLNFDRATIITDTNVEPRSATMRFRFVLAKPIDGGRRGSLAIELTQTWTRTGDCG